MNFLSEKELTNTARVTGTAILASLAIGILSALLLPAHLDPNLSADFQASSAAMLEHAQAGRIRTHLTMLLFFLATVDLVGKFILVGTRHLLLAAASIVVGISAAVFGLTGGLAAANGALLAESSRDLATAREFAMFGAMSDYASFHMTLVLASLANAGLHFGLLKSERLPAPIAIFGIFASLLVAFCIVSRDYVTALGHDAVTASFMGANLLSMIATGGYLLIRGVKSPT